MARAKKRAGRPRKQVVTLTAPIYEEGPTAATQGIVVVPIKNSPNGCVQRRRVDALERILLSGKLTMPEQQAAKAIRNAYERTEALSSGGPLKEHVQSSPKPDAAIASQVDVMSAWAHIMRGVRRDRAIIEHVCCNGQPLRTLPAKYKRRSMARLRLQLIYVALHLGFMHPGDLPSSLRA